MKGKHKSRLASEGYAYTFHGSYLDKQKAEAKAEKRKGFVISRVPRGMKRRRYIVLTERTLF